MRPAKQSLTTIVTVQLKDKAKIRKGSQGCCECADEDDGSKICQNDESKSWLD